MAREVADGFNRAEISMGTRGRTDEIIRLGAWREAREGGREERALVRQDEKTLRQKPFFLTGNDFFPQMKQAAKEALAPFRH